jgi:hypothetical protein
MIADNQWHTLSVSFDRDGYMKMYEDGVLLDSADISSVGDITTNAGLFFGTDINQTYAFNGSISEVRVWNSLISGQNIQNWQCNHLDNNHPNYSNLIGYWKLNEGTGTTMALDYVGGFGILNGTINNSTWYSPDSTWTYDYTNAPRLVDVPITALTHLCVPINNNWQLDGVSLIPDCTGTSLEEIDGAPKGLLKITDILGRTTKAKINSLLFYIYNNGSVEKKIFIE